MPMVILPTRQLVTECLSYEPIFHFISGGVKEVIRESIVSRSFYQRHRVNGTIPGSTGLIGSILTEFDNHVSRVDETTSFFTDRPYKTPMELYLEEMGKIELIVVNIEDMVNELLDNILRTRLFDILDDGTQWRGRDLMVNLRSFTRGAR